MNQNVHICVEGIQWDDLGDRQTTTSLSEGTYSRPGENHFLRYEECMEGIEQPVQNLVKLSPQEIYVKKSGPLSVRFTFQPGKETAGTYQSPYGDLPFRLFTKDIVLEEEEDLITARISYTLSFLSQPSLRHQITIRVQSLGKEA